MVLVGRTPQSCVAFRHRAIRRRDTTLAGTEGRWIETGVDKLTGATPGSNISFAYPVERALSLLPLDMPIAYTAISVESTDVLDCQLAFAML
jgi:hypothetical protein